MIFIWDRVFVKLTKRPCKKHGTVLEDGELAVMNNDGWVLSQEKVGQNTKAPE
jgi:hypothetical protein